ncbi:hypothetical protein BGZ73_002437 [Actinomortierella ambigua]|nr:hypothetical protein BGZ73_002437 [Actinomortierella ambigua]
MNIESVEYVLEHASPMAFGSPLPDKPSPDTATSHRTSPSSDSRVAISAAPLTSNHNGQSDKDFNSLMDRADNSDVDAFMALALYEAGVGVPVSESSAMYWYRRAADKGHTPAFFCLAEWLQNGHESIAQDKTEALKWYLAAAGKGHTEVQVILGHLYLKGSDTVSPNQAVALEWFRKAASARHADAAFNTGRMVANGQGTDRSDVKAYMWYRIAAETMQMQCFLLEKCASTGEVSNGTRMTRLNSSVEQQSKVIHEIDNSSQASRVIQPSDTGVSDQPSSADVSDVPMAADEDPSLYESIRVSSDNGLVWDLLQKDDNDDPEAQFMIGRLLEEVAEKFQEDSRDKKQRYSEAFKWYLKAAEQSHTDAQRTVARMYKEGRGVRHEDDEALRWLVMAAEGRDMSAQFELGSMYWFGQMVIQNDEEAVLWFGKAAKQGDADAQLMLSMIS